MAIMEITISPRSNNGVGISEHLLESIKVLKESGLTYEIHAMGTNVEGKAEALFELAHKMHQASFNNGVPRVATSIKIDERQDKDANMESKVNAVKGKL